MADATDASKASGNTQQTSDVGESALQHLAINDGHDSAIGEMALYNLTQANDLLLEMNNNLDLILGMLSSSDNNSEARKFNITIARSQTRARLDPLVNRNTGQPIPNFPANIPELKALTMPQVLQILQELGSPPVPANMARKALRKRIGLNW